MAGSSQQYAASGTPVRKGRLTFKVLVGTREGVLAYRKACKKPYPEFMTDQCRRLAVFVDRPSRGNFLWSILESTDDPAVWLDLQTGEKKFDSLSEAYEAGNSALLSYVEDQLTGPLNLAPDGCDRRRVSGIACW